jgi:hypothetical protein
MAAAEKTGTTAERKKPVPKKGAAAPKAARANRQR